MTARIAFYAPLKPPDHPIPSGDREIARLMMAALRRAGYDVELSSRFISYQKRPSSEIFAQRRAEGEAAAAAILARLRSLDPTRRPRLWFTYHPYCKAPDWLGPRISKALDIPYVTAEACRTRQDSDADWAQGRNSVRSAIRHATVNFCLKPSDRAYLTEILPSLGRVRTLAPFLDLDALPPRNASSTEGPVPTIVAAGMMRPGKKEACFLILADALKRIEQLPWRLVLIGDGPARPRIEAAFSSFSAERLEWTGALSHDDVIAAFDRADLLAWPGYREPIGMVYLEAAARGLPVAAFSSLGVPLVVEDGTTGLLTPEGDIGAYAQALHRLVSDSDLRRRLGAAGRDFVREKHDIRTASETMRTAIDPFLVHSRPEGTCAN